MLLHVPGKSYQKILENKSCNASSKSSLSKKKNKKKNKIMSVTFKQSKLVVKV